jgi:hypothetical protein
MSIYSPLSRHFTHFSCTPMNVCACVRAFHTHAHTHAQTHTYITPPHTHTHSPTRSVCTHTHAHTTSRTPGRGGTVRSLTERDGQLPRAIKHGLQVVYSIFCKVCNELILYRTVSQICTRASTLQQNSDRFRQLNLMHIRTHTSTHTHLNAHTPR